MWKSSPILLLLISACVGPIETRVDSRGLNDAQPVSILADTDVAVISAEARRLVEQALFAKGFRAASESPKADVSLHVTLSDRPADLSLNAGSDVLAPPSGKKRCAKREYRLGLTMIKIADGTIFYKSNAAEFHCKQTVQQVLPMLVDAALKDIGSPRGAYIVKRPR
jgi:hypothetical protein